MGAGLGLLGSSGWMGHRGSAIFVGWRRRLRLVMGRAMGTPAVRAYGSRRGGTGHPPCRAMPREQRAPPAKWAPLHWARRPNLPRRRSTCVWKVVGRGPPRSTGTLLGQLPANPHPGRRLWYQRLRTRTHPGHRGTQGCRHFRGTHGSAYTRGSPAPRVLDLLNRRSPQLWRRSKGVFTSRRRSHRSSVRLTPRL